eukprot:scaffold24028_cov152-Cylindrotheca_fusiformis.AAC.3
MAAPPPPMGAPPLPTGLPPPGPGVPSGLPPPMAIPAPNVLGGGAPPRIPFTPTILLTNAPIFLHTFKAVREWMYPCGSARNAVFYPKKNEDEELPHSAKVTVLVTMSHPDGAIKFLGSFKQFSSRLDQRYSQMQAYMVPASPDMPLPPPLLDEETQTLLGEKLWQNFLSLENPDANDDENNVQKLDVSKVAAAAGGGNYDPDEDPLNAPQVLEAVKEFRRKLDKTQSFQKKKRMELVARKLAEMRPRVKAMMEEEKTRPPMIGVPPPLPPPGMPGAPPPPPVGALPGPPGAPGLPPPPMPVGDSGKRGRSNLPAWMTQQQQAEEPSAKRVKTDGHPSNFPPLPPSTYPQLREFLSHQVRESLGEEDKTLIEFLYNHITQTKEAAALLQELQLVLEEEANTFMEALWQKIYQLQQQS